MEEIGPADLLVATFSVSEMPLELRDWLEPKYAGFRWLFFGATHRFAGMDNVEYFTGLHQRLGGKFFKDKHRNAWFLLCAR
jgi:hypothetical protein